jgi:septin family protein
VVGTRNSGKTSFLDFLCKSLALPPNKHPIRSSEEFDEEINSANFTSQYLETEIDGERVGLTLWDSEGLERNLVDLQMREITAFLESKFEDTFNEEMKVVRSPGARDTHIHCVFLILDPVRLDSNIAAAKRAAQKANGNLPGTPRVVGILDEDLDLQVLRVMHGKTTVVPVISKADTVSTAHMAYLKKAVWDTLKAANVNPLEILTLEEQEDYSSSESLDRFDENDEDESEAKSTAEEGGTADPADAQPESGENPAPTSPSGRSSSGRSQTTRKSAGSTSDMPPLPLSILSPDPHSLESEDGPVGRQFPWGFADPYNANHCDFVKLKDSVFKEWRSELREASREIWYERWRTSRLNRRSGSAPKQSSQGRYGLPPVKSGRATR